MSQYQKSYSAKINDQLEFVLTLANNLKSQVLSVSVHRKQDPQFLKLFQKMEYHLQTITPLDDDDEFDTFDHQDQKEDDFRSKSFAQIVGLSQFDQTFLESQNPSQFIHYDFLNFRNHLFNNSALVRGPYRSYRMDQKLQVLRLYKEGKSYAFISRFMQIPQKNIVRWCKNGVERKFGAGRKIGDSQMENKVFKWIRQSFKQGDSINPKLIRQKAMQMSTRRDFKSSKGWLKNFIRRHDLSQTYDIL